MKVVAVSDLHIPKHQTKMPALVKSIVGSSADVLIVGGDTAPDNDTAFEDFLGELSYFPGPKLYVMGNHDLWVTEGSSRLRYEKTVPELLAKNSFHSLDHEPFIYKNVGFAGNIGWYDYTFARVYAPAPGTQFIRTNDNKKVSVPEPVKWADLTEEDWRKKEIFYKGFFGMLQGTGCNDKDYIKDFWEDKEFCEMMQEKLDRHLAAIDPKVNQIVTAFHCVPFKEALTKNNAKPNICFTNAYAGSKHLGDILYRYKKVKLAVWGHMHNRSSFSKGNIKCVNISFDTAASNPVHIEF